MLRASVVLTLLGATGVTAAFALQSAKRPARPRFEVASVRPCRPDAGTQSKNGGLSFQNLSPNRLALNCATLEDLVHMSYISFSGGQFDPRRSVPIEGGPGWIHAALYLISAKAASAQTQGTLHGPMLQDLLEDRFRLKIRRETKEIPVYELKVARGGSRLRAFQEGSCTPMDFLKLASQFPPEPFPNLPPGQKYCTNLGENSGSTVKYTGQGMTLDELCKVVLSRMRVLDRPVIDKTGLTGRFDVRLVYSEMAEDASDDPAGLSIFAALEQQLGLKLEASKGPGEFLVIDHAERPTGN